MKTLKEKKSMKAALIIKSTMLLLNFLICIGLTACSKSDDDGDSSVTITGNYHYSGNSQDQYYYFKSNGTGTYEKDLSSTTGTANFTYKVSGNKITCKGIYTSTYNNDGSICNINTDWSSTLTYTNGTIYDASNNTYVKISN